MDDNELMRRIAQNDSSALKILVDRFQSKVLSLCSSLLDTRQNAEDMAQEIFFQVYRSAGKFRHDCLVSTWIYRIAVNRCRNFNRDNKKYRWLSGLNRLLKDDEPGNQPLWAPGAAGPESARIEEEVKNLIQGAVATLPEKQKTLLILHKYEGHSYKEIAEILGVSLSSVESGLHRAKMNLQKKLSPSVRNFCRGRKF